MRSRTSRRTAALVAVIVFLLWRGTRQARQLRRFVTAFTFAYPGEGVVNGIAGFFGGVAGDVKDFVLSAIRAAADFLQAGIDYVTNLAWSVWNLATDAVAFARDFATSLYWQALAYANGIYWQAVGYVDSVISGVRDFATSLYWQAINFAQAVASDLVNAATWALHALIDNVAAALSWAIDTASRLAADALHALEWALRTLIDNVRAALEYAISTGEQIAADGLHALEWALRTLIDNVRAGLNTAIHDAQAVTTTIVNNVANEIRGGLDTVNSYLFGPVQAILSVIETVLDWLIALATFPFTTARDIWSAFRQTGGQRIIDTMPDSVSRWGDHVLGRTVDYVHATHRDYTLPDLPAPPSGGGGAGGGGGVVGPGVGTPDRIAFGQALLAALGAPATDSNMAFLIAWMTHENTTASFNPLATTLDYGSNTIFNSVGVRNYADFPTGVEATRRTLLSSYYVGIVADLRNGDGHAAGQEHSELRTWSGGGYDTINV